MTLIIAIFARYLMAFAVVLAILRILSWILQA